MAGLDTRGVMDGFTQGFGLVDGYLNRQEANKRADQQMAMQERGLQMREKEFSAQQEDRQKQQDQQQIAQFYAGWASGIEAPVSEDMAGVFARNPMADPVHLFNPKTEQAVQYAEGLARGEGSLFSQQTVDAMNDFYAPRVSRGQGGKKRLAGMYPGQREGTLAFELEVEDEAGNKRLAPMTVNRGIAGDDDEVAQYDIQQAIGPVMGARSIYQALGQNREHMMSYLRASGYLPKAEAKWEQVQGPDGSILQRNTVTDEMKSVLGRRKAAGEEGDHITSQQSNYHFLRDQMGMSDEQAYQTAFGGTGAVSGNIPDGVRIGFNRLSDQIKAIDTQLKGNNGLLLSDKDRAQLQSQRSTLNRRMEALASEYGIPGLSDTPASAQQKQPDEGQNPAQRPQQQEQAGGAKPASSQAAGRVITMADVEHAARQRGMTTEQVIQHLRASGADVSSLGGAQPVSKPQPAPPPGSSPQVRSGPLSLEQQFAAAMQGEKLLQQKYAEARQYQPVSARGAIQPPEQSPRPWQGLSLSPDLLPR